jgi:hypothetical protein
MFDKLKETTQTIAKQAESTLKTATEKAESTIRMVSESSEDVQNLLDDMSCVLTEHTAKAAIEKLTNTLRIAEAELKENRFSAPVTITASATLGLIGLQMQITVPESSQ